MEKEVKLNSVTIYKAEDNIIYAKHHEATSFGINDAKEFIEIQLELANYSPYLLLTDLGDKFHNWTTEAKAWVAKHEKFNSLCKAQAIVVRSLPTRLILNSYMSFFKPKSKFKVFATTEEAEAYLRAKLPELKE